MDAKQSAFSGRMWMVLKLVSAFCVALLVSGCDGSNSSPVGISNETGYEIRRLTDNLGIDESPSWSPDGRSIAFFSKRDDNEDIYVMDASGDNLRNLTNHIGDNNDPSWSPDGHTIAFASDRDGTSGDIYVMDADGGNVRRLTNHTSQDGDPSWSPDGRSIAFFSLRDSDPAIEGINPEIYVMDADGDNVRRLTSHNAWDFAPSWSPDSRFVVFYSNRGDNRDVYVTEVFGRSNRGRRP